MAKSDAAGFLRQLEQTRRLLGAVKAGRARVEAEARAHIAAVRSERDAELKVLAAKLEEAINSYNRQARVDASPLLGCARCMPALPADGRAGRRLTLLAPAGA